MEGVIAVFIPIVFLLATAGTISFYIYARNIERALMIEKGIPLPEPEEKKKSTTTWLKIGILAIFVALGGVVSNLVQDYIINDIYIVVLFGGVGLVAGYLWERKEREREANGKKGPESLA